MLRAKLRYVGRLAVATRERWQQIRRVVAENSKPNIRRLGSELVIRAMWFAEQLQSGENMAPPSMAPVSTDSF